MPLQNSKSYCAAENEQIRRHAGAEWPSVRVQGRSVAARGSTSAMRMAIAPPMECPSKIVLRGSIVPSRMRDATVSVRAFLRFRKRERVCVVAMPGQIEQVGAEAVAGKIGAQIRHRAPVGAQSMQHDQRSPMAVTPAGGSRIVAGVWQSPPAITTSALGKAICG